MTEPTDVSDGLLPIEDCIRQLQELREGLAVQMRKMDEISDTFDRLLKQFPQPATAPINPEDDGA